MKDSLFRELLDNLPYGPNKSLVFVIDAFDECGDKRSRPALLRLLTDAAASASWLKIIITSRQEDDIQRVFDEPTRSSYSRYDLAEDQEASHDLRRFAQSEFGPVAKEWDFPQPWPEDSLLDRLISRADRLFIFIKTLALALERCEDPTGFLEANSKDAGDGLKPLYGLYSNILKLRITHSSAKFQRVIGVLLTAAPYRALCEETIAELAEVGPNLVKKWVTNLSSLLSRVEGTGGIRVRHFSISEFLVSDDCPHDYRIDLRHANVKLGVACLETMVSQLRFNICGLGGSRLANANVEDLPSRISRTISDSLQYSSLYWSNHLCVPPDKDDKGVRESLKKFFEGLYPLFWVEVLSLMEMIPMGVPSLQKAISWAKVSPTQLVFRVILIGCRMGIRPFLRDLRTFVASSSPLKPPLQPALHTPICQRDPSCPHARLYQTPSTRGLLDPSRWWEGNCRLGPHRHRNGLGILGVSRA